MPEVKKWIQWQNATWDDMHALSGTGRMQNRPYYYRILGSGKQAKLLLISAVPSNRQKGAAHATDYLRMGQEEFQELARIFKQ